jgi:hypothetical protein
MSGPCLYATPDELAVIRRRLAEHDWYARCFANLRGPADELLRRGFEIPREKGFVFYETCPVDNTALRQDPFNPRDHLCPACGRNYTDEPYHRAWITFFQSYLSQRAVEMGIAYGVTGDDAYAEAIRRILRDYARHYADYPLVDCVLGPTHLFQSTYIESLWLASLAAAADFARDAIPAAEWRLLRDELFLPAARVILDYDEGDNNRQAMNNVALGFVGLLCEEPSLVERAVRGEHGWLDHLAHSVLADGMWYEGDNYHFATLPALINLAEGMTRHGLDLYAVETGGRRLKMMFDAPLLDLYPDLTFPARKDSRYDSPLGQRWYVGMYELAFRRYGDPAYARLLRTLYTHPPREKDCIANAAGLIDVLPSRPANRERLDWRGFLNAVPDLGEATGVPVTTSVNMAGTGLGILRTDGGRTYASVDYGHYGGGHGHPDRLQLNLYARGRPWLTDFGTGNYFFDHLRWYRSTIGHNTVAVDGRTQQAVAGRLRRFGAAGEHGLIAAEVTGAYQGVRCRRTTVLLSSDLLLDLFIVEADREHCLDWSLHPCATLAVDLAGDVGPLAPATIAGEHYEWLQDIHRAAASGDWLAIFRQDDDVLAVHVLGQPATEVYLAAAFGPPPAIPDLYPVLIARRRAARTTFAALIEHRAGGRPLVAAFRAEGKDRYLVALRDGGRIVCRYDDVMASATIERFGADGELLATSRFGPDDRATDEGDVEAPPIALDAWLPNLAGPRLRIRITNRGAAPRAVAVAVEREATLDLPIDWTDCGEPLTVRAECGDFVAERSLPPAVARLGREYALDRAEQVCRGERPWGGPVDLSARFRVDREGDALVLRVAVTDDAVVCSGPVEGQYDYDGVQVYFDPRDDAARGDASLTGVCGLLLIPASAEGTPARILPIAPARSGTDAAASGAPSLGEVHLDSALRADGYDLTLIVPLAHLGRIPASGDKIGFDLIVNDNDGTFRRAQQMIWTGAGGSRIWLRRDYHPPQRFGVLVL